MRHSTKDKYSKKRKPLIVLVCEGRNQSETLYFEHFNKREAPYSLKIKGSESTDIKNMAKKADSLYKDYQMDSKLGDKVFCLIDLDLNQQQVDAYNFVKFKYKHISFIVSNPCFEVWLLYYFTANPKVEPSSQKVKEQLSKYVEDYTESTDVIKVYNLEDKYSVAINNSEKKNLLYQTQTLIDKNPYTKIQDVVLYLNEIQSN